MPRVLDEGRLSALRVKGGRLSENLARRVVGTPALDLSTTQVSQLTFALHDPGFAILESSLFRDRSRIDYGDLPFEVAALETGGFAGGDELLTVTARSRGAQKMKRAKGALMLRNVSPTEFMAERAAANGLGFLGEPSAKRAQVLRADPKGQPSETDWTAGQRLAKELGYWMFEDGLRLYFARPSWLIKRTRELEVHYPRARDRDAIAPTQIPVCRRSLDAEEGKGRTIDLSLAYNDGGRGALPGVVVAFSGIQGFAADYIASSVGFTFAQDSDVRLALVTPIDPVPEPPEADVDLNNDGVVDVTGDPVDDGGNSGSRSDQASAEGFTWPVSGPVTSGFGPRGGRMHEGIDIGVPDGTACKAANSGTVTIVAYDADGYGNWIEIDHGGGLSTRYGHFQKTSVSSGQHVERGELIGYTDSTGNATGPHLHFETRRSGVPFDPMTVLP